MTTTSLTAPAPRKTRPSPHEAWRWLHHEATSRYRGTSRFAWHFARGKLGRDPVFRALLERGELTGRPRVVDIGCGQGLMASLLQSCSDLQAADAWPDAWPAAPLARSYTGIELMANDVERAEHALAGLALAPRFDCG
jgi:hypothetical protein